MKPSERIKEIVYETTGGGIGSAEISLHAIVKFLDEMTACSRGEHDDEVWNDIYKCKKCKVEHS